MIEDWPARFRLANYTDEQKRVVNLAHSKMDEWFEYNKRTDWNNVVPQEKTPIALSIDCLTSARGFNVLRATGIIPHEI